jgi:hypothetical protein
MRIQWFCSATVRPICAKVARGADKRETALKHTPGGASTTLHPSDYRSATKQSKYSNSHLSKASNLRNLCQTGRVYGPYNLGFMPNEPKPGTHGECELCGRHVGQDRLTRHHLLPRSHARRMRRRRRGRRELRRRDPSRTVALCSPCHRKVHAALSNGDLGRGYDSLEALREHPDVRRFTEWVRGKPGV